MTVKIVKVYDGRERTEWLCPLHIAELEKRGSTVTVKRPESFPQSNTKGLECDRCPPQPESAQ